MESLLITTICRRDNPAFLELAKIASKYECYINYTQLFSLGLDNSLTMQVSGNWSNIAKIESALSALVKGTGIELLFKRVQEEKSNKYFLPYLIQLITLNQPGIVYEVQDFLASLSLRVQYLQILTKMHFDTPMLQLDIQIDLPAENNIADIREQFLLFCDELNLDGTMEPKKIED